MSQNPIPPDDNDGAGTSEVTRDDIAEFVDDQIEDFGIIALAERRHVSIDGLTDERIREAIIDEVWRQYEQGEIEL